MTYDLTQTTYLFSWISNAASGILKEDAPTEQDLAACLGLALVDGGSWTGQKNTYTFNGFMKEIGSQFYGGQDDWAVAWGPAVYQHKNDDEADNAMFVVHSPSQDVYICAIAATNPNSTYDWLREDLSVGPLSMADFSPILNDPPSVPAKVNANASTSQTSYGTALGVYHLLTMKSAKHTIVDFIKTIPQSATTQFIFTGHSLGGALSPTLAYQLQQTLTTNRLSAANIFVLPTAGASPGNAVYANSWGSLFKPATPKGTLNPGNQANQLNTLYYSTYDVVPHAWNYIYTPDNSDNSNDYYFYSYQPHDLKLSTLQTQIGVLEGPFAKAMAATGEIEQNAGANANMAYLPTANRVGLELNWPITYWDSTAGSYQSLFMPTTFSPTSVISFKDAAAIVHVWQYFEVFNIDPSLVPRAIDSISPVEKG